MAARADEAGENRPLARGWGGFRRLQRGNLEQLSRRQNPTLLAYLLHLTAPRFVLWCYLIWWLGVALPYFDPDPWLWLNSLGISAIIGTGLLLSTSYAGATPVRLGRWVVARLYMMPFFVSSFAALIKGRGFLLVFHPSVFGNLAPLGVCVALGCSVLLLRRWSLIRRLSGVRSHPVT